MFAGDTGPAPAPGTAPGQQVALRRAVEDDAAAVARLAHDLSVADGGRPAELTADAFRRDGFGDGAAFRAMLAEIDSGLDGAAENEVVGYALYYPGYDSDRATRGVYLADLYVAPEHRRRGIGRALMTAVARECRDNGGRWMFWSVLKRNRAARRFYRTIAPELRDIVVCAAFGAGFERLAGGDE
jgi:ribosomal protein S18 acetylase RimI-like enzyme